MKNQHELASVLQNDVTKKNEREVANLLQNDSTKLFTWLAENSDKVKNLLDQDKSLKSEDKQDMLRALNSSVLNENGSCYLLTSPQQIQINKTASEKVILNEPAPVKQRNSSGKRLSIRVPRIMSIENGQAFTLHGQALTFQRHGSGSLESPDSDAGSDRSGDKKSPRNSPRISPKARPDSPHKRPPTFFSASAPKENTASQQGLDFKINKPVYTIPIETPLIKQYIEFAKKQYKEFKGATIKIQSPDDKFELIVTTENKQTKGSTQIFLIDRNKTIGKGAYATIFPAFNLNTRELVCAKIFRKNETYIADKEKIILIMLHEHYKKEHYQISRYHGFYESREGCILLKNYEQGITLQDFLYETNPHGEEYNLCLQAQVTQPAANTLYIECTDDYLQYKVITPTGEIAEGRIAQKEFPYCILQKDLPIQKLTPFTDKILQITSERGHTHPKYYLNKKTYSPELIQELILQTMKQIDILHDCGIIHRDINPKNIIVDFKGNKPIVNLIDFDSAISLETVCGYNLQMKLPNSTIEKKSLYVEIKNHQLMYTVLNPSGMQVTDYIKESDLGCLLNDSTDIQKLKRFLPKIIEITSKREHSHGGNPQCGSPGETPGYTPPVINYVASPYDITYDIWQLAIVIASIITEKHLANLIRETHFEIYPEQITFSIICSLLNDVFEKGKEELFLDSNKDIAENITKLVYHNIIFPILSELAYSMANTRLEDSSLLDEIKKLWNLEKECNHFVEQLKQLFLNTVDAHSTLKSIINNNYHDKYSSEICDALVEPLIYTNMQRDISALFKSKLTVSPRHESANIITSSFK